MSTFFERAHRYVKINHDDVQTTTPHLHDAVYFFTTAGHGYLVADFMECPDAIYAVLADAHMADRMLGIGEEDCAWGMVMLVAAEMFPDANWDAGYGADYQIGTPARLEQAIKCCMRWFPEELQLLLAAMRVSGDQWANYADCIESVMLEVPA